MTKKDYELIANAFNVQLKGCKGITTLEGGIKLMAFALADDLAEENARFDKKRFLTACGIENA